MQKQNVVLHNLVPKDYDETRLHFVVLNKLNPERL